MSLLGGLVGGAFNAVGDALGPFGQIFKSVAEERQYEERFEQQEELMFDVMNLQNQYNIDAFNRENEYNAPINQVRRMHQAGINPNWQGNISNVAGDQNSVVQPAGVPDVAALRNSVQQKRALLKQEELQNLQKDVIVSEAEKNMSESNYYRNLADKTETETAGQQIANKKADIDFQYAPKVYDAQINELNEKANNWKSQADYQKAMEDYTKAIQDPTVQEINARVQEAIANRDFTTAKTITERELLPYIKRKYGSEAESNMAQAYYFKCNGRAVLMNAEAYGRSVDNQYALGVVDLGIKWALAESEIKMKNVLGDLYKQQGKLVGQQYVASLFWNIVQGQLTQEGIPQGIQRRIYEKLGIETATAEENLKMTKNEAEYWLSDHLTRLANQTSPSQNLLRGASSIIPFQPPVHSNNNNSQLMPFNQFQTY